MKTGSSLSCSNCGAELLSEMTPGGVVTPEGEEVPFRRHTDHVMCSCLASYRITDLREVVAQVEARMRSYTAS